MSEIIINYIKEKRPTITKSSLKTYESILRNLYDKIGFNTKDYEMNKFNESDKIIKYLKDLPSNKRKTILSALVVITDNKNYRDLMLDDIKEYNKEEAKQTKTKNQEDNWVDKNEMTDTYNNLVKTSKFLYKKDKPSNTELQDLQMYIIISLLGGFFIPPRRSKDYVDFKIRDIDINKDNYIDKDELVFNAYKTAKTYGQQRVKLPKTLKTILNKWIKVNPTDYLLFDTNLGQLSNVKLNQRLNKLFGKKAGVNMMRKSFLTDKYADLIDIKNELNNDMKNMGSSTLQENIYIKKSI